MAVRLFERPPPDGKTRKAVSTRPVEEVQLPLVMELKRPRKTRFELQFAGQTAVQVFDGTQAWKFRPFLNRREVGPYTADELKIASFAAEQRDPAAGAVFFYGQGIRSAGC